MDETTPRWLIVVPPSQQALYEVLRQNLKEDSPVTVVYDRPDGWLGEYETVKVVQMAPARGVPPPPAPAPQSCPECGLEIEFEIPHFPQPPARLVIEAVHAGDQHYVEIHAFTATGRPLLSQRNQAWRRGGAR